MMSTNISPLDGAIGKRLKSRRRQLGLSQESLSLALEVTFEQVQGYEAGADRIEAGRLLEIAEILKVPVLFFFRDALSGTDNEGEREVLDFLDTACGLRLVQAFGRIRDPHVRRSIIELVEQVAADVHRDNTSIQK